MKFRILSLLLLMFNLGCSGTSDPVAKHDAPAVKTIVNAKTKSESESDLAAKISSFSNLGPSSENKNFLTQAKMKYLDISNWENISVSASDEFRSFINSVHKELLKESIANRWTELPEFFKKICDTNLENCKFYDILKSSPYTSELMVDVASEITDVESKFRLILIAFELNNSVFSTKNSLAFLDGLKNYRESLVKNDKKRLLARLDGALGILLEMVQSGKLVTEKLDWLASLPLTKSLDNNFNYLAGQNWTSKKDNKVMNSDELDKEIQARQLLGSSYTKKIEWLEKNMPQLLKQFKIVKAEKNAYFFVVDQLMTDQWSTSQAHAFFKGAGLELVLLGEMANNYLMLQIVDLLGKSQFALKDLMQGSEKRDAIMFFEDGKNKLNSGFLTARALPDRFQKIVNLSMLVSPSSPETGKIEKLRSGLEKTLKVSLTYPVTLALFDIGLRLGISPLSRVPISKYHLSGSLPFEMLVIQFFRGKLPPLLDYTVDLDESNSFEVSEGIEFAVRSGIFEGLNTSADDAMSRFVELYFQSNMWELYGGGTGYIFPSKLRSIQDNYDHIERVKNQTLWNDLINTCNGLKSGVASTKRALSIMDMADSPTLGKATYKMTASGDTSSQSFSASNNKTAEKTSLSYNPMMSARVDLFEHFRLDIFPTIAIFESIASAVEKNEIKMIQTRKKLDYVKNLMKKYSISFLDVYKKSSECWYQLLQIERKTAVQIVNYELQYWKWAQEQNRIGKFSNSTFTKNLPEGIQYRTNFSGDNLILNDFDILLRSRSYLMYGLPELGLPPINPSVEIIVTSGLNTLAVYKEAKIYTVPASSNGNEFAKAVSASSGLSGTHRKVEWFNAKFAPFDLFGNSTYGFALMFRVSPYLKQNLGIDSFFTAEKMIEEQKKVYSFLHTTTDELKALDAVGLTSWYTFKYSIMTDWLVSEQNQAVPYMDQTLSQLSGRWMGSFGNKLTYENPNNDTRVVRPPSLSPWPDQGRKLYEFILARNLDKKHQFKDMLSASEGISDHFKSAFADDYRNLNAFADKVQKLETINVFLDAKIESRDFQSYSYPALENLRATIQKFHNDTGQYFKPKN